MPKETKHRDQRFRKAWSQKEGLNWVEEVKNDPFKAFCRICSKELSAELTVIKRHGKSQDHIKLATGISQVGRLDSHIRKDYNSLENKVKNAEILIDGFLIHHNIAFRAADHLIEVLKHAFPDSEIASKIKLGRTKATGVVLNVIGDEAKKELASKLRKYKFSILTDESTDISTKKTAVTVVRFFDEELGTMSTKFWNLSELYETNIVNAANAENLFKLLMHTFEEYNIPHSNFIGFASDGASVMMGPHNSVASRMLLTFPGITIIKCICHSLHICASEASKLLPRRLEELSRAIYTYFQHSAKRQAEFRKFQDFLGLEIHKFLHPSQTRWLSVEQVVVRILEEWEALAAYFNKKKNEERLISVTNISEFLSDPIVKLFYMFLKWVLPKVNNVNRIFQSNSINITDAHKAMCALYKDILLSFLKRDYVQQSQLDRIDVQDSRQHILEQNLYLGAELSIQLSKPEYGDKHMISEFRSKCKQYLMKLCLEIQKRYDFNSSALELVSVLTKESALSDCKRAEVPSLAPLCSRVPRICMSHKIQDIDDDWRLLALTDLPDSVKNAENIEAFWIELYKLKNASGETVFKTLPLFVLQTFSLPISNAECERKFSKINQIKVPLRNKLITNTIDGCMLASDIIGACDKFKPSKTMIDGMTSDNIYKRPCQKLKQVITEEDLMLEIEDEEEDLAF